jgi:hypothetical protein
MVALVGRFLALVIDRFENVCVFDFGSKAVKAVSHPIVLTFDYYSY